MSTVPRAPLINLRIRPVELVILAAYLADRSRKERSSCLRGFLAYVSHLVIEDALCRMYSKVRAAHEKEQAEAFLEDLYRG